MAKFYPDAFLSKTAPSAAAAFDPDAFLAATAPEAAASAPLAMPSQQQFASAVPQLDAQGQIIRLPTAPPTATTAFEQNYPTAFKIASGARDVLGPTIEGLATAGGALAGAPLGPAGMVGGAGLGYGISQEVLRGADVALGRAQPRTGMETITEPVGNVAFGSVMEAGVPKVMSYVGKGVGRIIDFAKGNRADIKAANMLRQSLESGTRAGVEPAVNALRQALPGQTAAQATADLKAPLWQSLNASVARQRGAVDDYANVLANQQANDIADLARFAGGETATESRLATQAAQRELTGATAPMREEALERATATSEDIVRLQGEAATAREGATIKTADARRMASIQEKAAARANQNFPVEGMPRVSGRYSYWGDEGAAMAEKQLTDAAKGSLKFGEAARLREAALESLESAGLAPLQGKPLADQVRALTKDPAFAGNRERNIALSRVAREIEQWTGANGVIDAHALDAIRKNSVNSIFANSPLSPKAKAKAVAQTMNAIRPALIDAVETAGGAGYRDYLQAYQAGMQTVNQKQLMGAALDLYKNKPDEFIKLVDGDIPKSVEKIMGYGNFNLASELGEEALTALRGAAQTLKNAKEMTSQSSMAQDALRELLAENVSLMRLPSLISAKFAATNAAISILEKKIGKRVMGKLVSALRSGTGAADLLETLPAQDRMQVLQVLSDPRNYGIPAGGLGVGAASAAGSTEYLQGLASDPVGTLTGSNQLAPPNLTAPQNQLAR
jgi:hypothetical protein